MSSPSLPQNSRAGSLPAYPRPTDRFDEGIDPKAQWRADWQNLITSLGPNPAGKLTRATEACRRAILEQDVSMNVYSGEQSDARPWPLDVVPLLIGSEDWDKISDGLRQRARLYNELLTDLYGPQKLLRNGQLPAALAMANPDYLRACAGLGQGRGPFLHTYAADLARSPDGRWWVIQDRLDAPSGLGYALQNRIIVRQCMAETFHGSHVGRLHGFLRRFRESLERRDARGHDATVAFLTPGTANETYFEHAYLARYLGYPLVEGADLLTRDRRVFLRTVGGLKRIDTLIRRLDSDYCDPLELNDDSVLGVPGLVAAAKSGRVNLANQLGARALESNALLAFLGPLCRHVTNEPLRSPSAATWWCGQPEALRYVLANLHALVIKPAFASADAPPTRYGALLDRKELQRLAEEIRARPWAYCGQERIFLGTTPGWDAASASLKPMPFVVRVFLSWSDGDYHVMPGGLTRCNPNGDEGDVSLRAGSVTKDTWIIHSAPRETAPPTIRPTVRPAARHASTLPSRLADNFFWLGRYLERTSSIARLLHRLGPLLQDDIAVLDPGVAEDASRVLLDLQQSSAPPTATIDAVSRLARRTAIDRDSPGGLAANVQRLARVLETVRVRLPTEAWQIARELRLLSLQPEATDGEDKLRSQLAALDGVLFETLPRDTAWRFLDLGRCLECAAQTLALVRRMLGSLGETAPTEFRLQTALHLAAALFAYRTVHHGAFAPEPVLRWLVEDAENPRSLRYQAQRIDLHLAALPSELAPAAVAALRHRAFELLSAVRLIEPSRLTEDAEAGHRAWDRLDAILADLNNRLAQVYFSHLELSGAQSLA